MYALTKVVCDHRHGKYSLYALTKVVCDHRHGKYSLYALTKVVCDHRHGKYSLYALTTGIVFEYHLKTGVAKDWLASDLKYGTDRLNKAVDCVKRWPEVDSIRYADPMNSAVGSYNNTVCNHPAQHHTVTELIARGTYVPKMLPRNRLQKQKSVNHDPFDSWQMWQYL